MDKEWIKDKEWKALSLQFELGGQCTVYNL